MRPIKFRAWNIFYGEMHTWEELIHPMDINQKEFHHTKLIFQSSLFQEIILKIEVKDKYHLMQFAGLYDKNGVEIYEGDIIKNTRTGDGFMDGEIIDIRPVEYSEIIGGFTPFILHRQFDNYGYYELEWEVLGNIHQNPGLLSYNP